VIERAAPPVIEAKNLFAPTETRQLDAACAEPRVSDLPSDAAPTHGWFCSPANGTIAVTLT
jgi:hypothetical protein